MTEWSVTAETSAPEGAEVPDEVFDAFNEALEEHFGVGSLGVRGWSATITVDADGPVDAARIGVEILDVAARWAGLPSWPYVEVQILEAEEADRQLSIPNFPDVVGSREAAEMLGVSRQRLFQLRTVGRFPAPMVELAATPIWLRSSVEGFLASWDRKIGRPAE